MLTPWLVVEVDGALGLLDGAGRERLEPDAGAEGHGVGVLVGLDQDLGDGHGGFPAEDGGEDVVVGGLRAQLDVRDRALERALGLLGRRVEIGHRVQRRGGAHLGLGVGLRLGCCWFWWESEEGCGLVPGERG